MGKTSQAASRQRAQPEATAAPHPALAVPVPAYRFGIETKEIVEEKKKARADRFGAGAASGVKPATAASDEYKRKLEERAKRFGPAS